jgi:hypothetical protein
VIHYFSPFSPNRSVERHAQDLSAAREDPEVAEVHGAIATYRDTRWRTPAPTIGMLFMGDFP